MEEIVGKVTGVAPCEKGVYVTLRIEGMNMEKAVRMFYMKLGEDTDTNVFQKKEVRLSVN